MREIQLITFIGTWHYEIYNIHKEGLLKPHSSKNNTQLFRVAAVQFKGRFAIIETSLGLSFTVANHPALQRRGDKLLTVTVGRADGEDEDGCKLTLSVGDKKHNLRLADSIGGHDLSSEPRRPVDDQFDSLIVSPGPDW